MNNIQYFRKLFFFFFTTLLLAGCISGNQPITKRGKHYIRIDSTIGFSDKLEATIKPYREKIKSKMGKVIGYSDIDMPKGRPESYLTNFVSDIILQEGIKTAKENKLPIPVMSIINTKGLRSPIKKGAVTVESIYRLMPFENKMVILRLNGRDMEKLFDHMAEFGGEGMSGASFGIKDKKAVNIKIDGKPFNPKNTYTIVVPDYISHGGDRYYMLKGIDDRYDTDILIRDAIIDGIEERTKQNKHITSTLDKRVYHVN